MWTLNNFFVKHTVIIGSIIFIIISSNVLLVQATDIDATVSEFNYTAVIPQGGHYKSRNLDLDSGDTVKIDVEVTEGGPVDVYVMTFTQYSNAYNVENESEMVISYLKADENERTVTLSFTLPEDNDDDAYGFFEYYNGYGYDTLYVIIDNRNSTLTSEDADSVGPVKATLEIKLIRTATKETTEEFEDTVSFGCCLIIIILIIIVVIGLILLFSHSHNRDRGPYATYPQYTQPYYYHPSYQYTAPPSQYTSHQYSHQQPSYKYPQYPYYNPYYYQYPYSYPYPYQYPEAPEPPEARSTRSKKRKTTKDKSIKKKYNDLF